MKTYAVGDLAALQVLAKKYEADFLALDSIENSLLNSFALMDDPIRALILAVATGEPLLFIGEPGTAKSNLVRVFCKYIGVYPTDEAKPASATNGDKASPHPDYFEYLLTPFTEPSELFGYFEIREESNVRRIERNQTGMMQSAKVVYLDEVFNGSSAILNSLLAFMNERIFHERGTWTQVEMRCLFGASNQTPDRPELRAVFDRFLLRCWIDNLSKTLKPNGADDLTELLEKGWQESFNRAERYNPANPDFVQHPQLLNRLDAFQRELGAMLANSPLFDEERSEFVRDMSGLVKEIRTKRLSVTMSNRRVIKFVRLMLIDRMYEAVRTGSSDMRLTERQFALWRYIVDERDELRERNLNQFTTLRL